MNDALKQNEQLRALLGDLAQKFQDTNIVDECGVRDVPSGVPPKPQSHLVAPPNTAVTPLPSGPGVRHPLKSIPSAEIMLGSFTQQGASSADRPSPNTTKVLDNAGKNSRRHKRTETPEQRFIRAAMGGRPVFTMGMAAQSDRGLLVDFLEEIKRWATKWGLQGDMLSTQQQADLLKHPALLAFVNDTSALRTLIIDVDMRFALLAAVVSRDIFYHTASEHFLYNSGHPYYQECDDLFTQFSVLGHGDELEKHELLLKQQTLYTRIKELRSHKSWRDAAAERLSVALVQDLGILVHNNGAADRDHGLQELYVKGYRIGFRMRMAAAKWKMSWPAAGADFNEQQMVNESRKLCGSPIETHQAVSRYPMNYSVRFAMSPTIIKSEFVHGVEEMETVHSALVHIVKKSSHISAERGLRAGRERQGHVFGQYLCV
ncbi:hypothetical protein BDV95DRAFT_326646 [Massariosphaeria phaeospora]|uniref:Uncharacterized protein n=1 Tax=Massariosphaeria phaeospora TaxID=100035 RepID=A0A7C8I9Z2_9PLEO|nr:hypothetical protein BDV95DRAFT_326646 [Massariosphaeria phaeospora]